MTFLRPVAEKKFRMYNGDLGTEYEALAETLKHLQTQQQSIEDKIEEVTRRLATAEGRPVDV